MWVRCAIPQELSPKGVPLVAPPLLPSARTQTIQLETFATLSPIPSFRGWLEKKAKHRAALGADRSSLSGGMRAEAATHSRPLHHPYVSFFLRTVALGYGVSFVARWVGPSSDQTRRLQKRQRGKG